VTDGGYSMDELKDGYVEFNTVGELMEILQNYPKDMKVVLDYGGATPTISEFDLGKTVLNIS
jgi:hypothetical protein